MKGEIKTKYGTVIIKKASQIEPYKLYRKVFKNKAQKLIIEEFEKIVKKYYSNSSEKDIAKLYSILSKSGCTYATMANILMEQLGNDNEVFKEYFGYSLGNSDGTINYNKLMLDIYACISEMVEISIHVVEVRKFASVIEAANILTGREYNDSVSAINELNRAGWIADGIDKDGMLVFRHGTNHTKSLIGSYREIAKELFGCVDPNIGKKQLEELFKQNNLEYKFNYIPIHSKFSGLDNLRANNLGKWMNKYFEVHEANLSLSATIIETKNVDVVEFINSINLFINNGYSIEVSAHDKDVWMQNGKDFDKPAPNNNGHAMNFLGFDDNGNILVCSWGKTYSIALDFYQKLEFTAIKIESNNKGVKKGI